MLSWPAETTSWAIWGGRKLFKRPTRSISATCSATCCSRVRFHVSRSAACAVTRSCASRRSAVRWREQPRVLDGDDRLLREIRDKLDLLLGEWADFLTKDGDDSNQLVILKHRHSNGGPNPAKLNSG